MHTRAVEQNLPLRNTDFKSNFPLSNTRKVIKALHVFIPFWQILFDRFSELFSPHFKQCLLLFRLAITANFFNSYYS